MDAFIRFLESINEWVGRVFGWAIMLLTFTVAFEVVLRYVFNSPTVCSFEITKQFYAFYFMILCGYALLHGSHVAVDVVYQHLSYKTKTILDLISYLVFFFPFVISVLYFGTRFAASSWSMFEMSWSACDIPMFPIKTVVPLSFFLIFLQGVVNFIRIITRLIGGENRV